MGPLRLRRGDHGVREGRAEALRPQSFPQSVATPRVENGLAWLSPGIRPRPNRFKRHRGLASPHAGRASEMRAAHIRAQPMQHCGACRSASVGFATVEIVYPAVRYVARTSISASLAEHIEMKRLIQLLRQMPSTMTKPWRPFATLSTMSRARKPLSYQSPRRSYATLGDLGFRITRRRVQLVAPSTWDAQSPATPLHSPLPRRPPSAWSSSGAGADRARTEPSTVDAASFHTAVPSAPQGHR